jgi:hypothetical protein
VHRVCFAVPFPAGCSSSGRAFETLVVTCAAGSIIGLICIFGERALNNSPVVMLANDPISRDTHDDRTKDDSYFAVQLAKLYREREPKFGTDIIQTLAAVLASLVWDVIVPAPVNIAS